MIRLRGQSLLLILAGLGSAVVFVAASTWLSEASRPKVLVEMQVALPRAVQVVMAAGDRFLAANLAGFRALVASTENMQRDNYRIQARVQSDAAWLNPAHEDNYYIAAAILPWNGEVAAAQYVLRRAADARPFDWQPAFYFAFNELTFHKSPFVAARWLNRAAASTSDEMQKIQLQQLAAQWSTKSADPALAIRLHREMARQTRYKAFAEFLEKRAQRLENQMVLSRAWAAYRDRTGENPGSLEVLVAAGLIDRVPADPFGASYLLGADGTVTTSRDVAH